MHVQPLSVLDRDAERLLRMRALEHARDADTGVQQLQTALQTGKIGMVCLYDDEDEPRGLAAWRWQDEARSYAQVIMLYTPLASPPEPGEALVDYLVTALGAEPTLKVIEARVRDESPGVRESWTRHGFVFFERCRMLLRLGQLPLPVVPTPIGFSVTGWDDEYLPQIDELIATAHRQSIDIAAVPDAPVSSIVESMRRLRSGTLSGAGTWNDAASLIAFDDKRKQVVGCVAVSQTNGSAVVVDIAVHPAYQRRGLARLLMVRSMTACLKQRLMSISLAVTTRNPGRSLCNQLGFQTTTCGEVAIWWYDGRQTTYQ
jgi:GNAT superfamily N-acetyltransferase